jgi:glycosyltransferase involved in cell wall biosynthesis
VANPPFAEELARKGRKRAERFTWRRCAEETYRVYESAAASPG